MALTGLIMGPNLKSLEQTLNLCDVLDYINSLLQFSFYWKLLKVLGCLVLYLKIVVTKGSLYLEHQEIREVFVEFMSTLLSILKEILNLTKETKRILPVLNERLALPIFAK
ncbi:hypothetical protein A4A49_52924 [Nicotiana attenuata]|uniref:Uncharacterized protein n=1 Tax=Nicotiana attenuata TaxID=49451 RepID=A0A1J6L959_NICAT|nr:hypothetical protein A4A49_52924 [Nicotiana attenuata]